METITTPRQAGQERAALRLTERLQKESDVNKQSMPRQFVSFTFYKIRPEWRMLPDDIKQSGRSEFIEVSNRYEKDLIINSYSLVGLRANAEFMTWRIGYSLDPIQSMSAKLAATGLGKYLDVGQTFLSMTKRSIYMDKANPEHIEDRLHIVPGKSKYLFVYPFVKTRDWYQLSLQQRQIMMDEHIRIGMKYSSVKLNTTYSFGLDDQEFVVAFETDEPADFLDLVQELRETKASSFTLRDTPMYTCRLRLLNECLDEL